MQSLPLSYIRTTYANRAVGKRLVKDCMSCVKFSMPPDVRSVYRGVITVKLHSYVLYFTCLLLDGEMGDFPHLCPKDGVQIQVTTEYTFLYFL